MLRQLALMVSLMMLSSCATVFAEETRSFVVTSSPPGATIHVNGEEMGVTPIRLSVNDHDSLQVTVRKEGFHGGGCIVNTRIKPIWVIGDLILILFVFPLVVDLLTNDWSSLKSGYCTVHLTPIGGA